MQQSTTMITFPTKNLTHPSTLATTTAILPTLKDEVRAPIFTTTPTMVTPSNYIIYSMPKTVPSFSSASAPSGIASPTSTSNSSSTHLSYSMAVPTPFLGIPASTVLANPWS
jgi:hypothetical protein